MKFRSCSLGYLVVVPSARAFNSYLAGLKYEIGNSWAINNPQTPAIRQLDGVTLPPLTSPPSSLLMDSSPATDAASFTAPSTKDYVSDTLRQLLEDSLPEMLIPSADSLLTTVSDADIPNETPASLDECANSYNDVSMYGVEVPDSPKLDEPKSVMDIAANIQHEILITASHQGTSMPLSKVESYCAFGMKPQAPAQASSSVSGSYLETIASTEGGISFSTMEHFVAPSASTSTHPVLADEPSPSAKVELESAQVVPIASSRMRKPASYLGLGEKSRIVASGDQVTSSGYLSGLAFPEPVVSSLHSDSLLGAPTDPVTSACDFEEMPSVVFKSEPDPSGTSAFSTPVFEGKTNKQSYTGFGVKPKAAVVLPRQIGVGGDVHSWIAYQNVVSSSSEDLPGSSPAQSDDLKVIASKTNSKPSFSGFGVMPKHVPNTVNSWMAGGVSVATSSAWDDGVTSTTTSTGSPIETTHLDSSSPSSTVSAGFKKSSYSAFGVKPRIVECRGALTTGYLSGLADAGTISSGTSASTHANGTQDSLFLQSHPASGPDDVTGENTNTEMSLVKKSSSYSGFGVKHAAPKIRSQTTANTDRSPVKAPTNVSIFTVHSPAQTKTSVTGLGINITAAESTSQTDLSNVDATITTLDVNASPPKKASFTGFGVKYWAPETRIQSVETVDPSNAAVQDAIAATYIGSITSSSVSSTKKRMYSGFGGTPVVQRSGNAYLDNLANVDNISTSLNEDKGSWMKNEMEHSQPGNHVSFTGKTELYNADQGAPTVNAERFIHPVSSVESSWVSGKSLSECSATPDDPASSTSQPSRAASSAAHPSTEPKSLPLIHSYSPTQWTLNRPSFTESLPSSNSKIFTGATIEPIDSSLRDVDFPPPTEGPAQPSGYLASLSGSDSSNAETKKPSFSGFGVIHKNTDHTNIPGDLDSGVSVVPELDAVSEEVRMDPPSSRVSNKTPLSIDIGGVASYLDSLPGSAPASGGAWKKPSYSGFGASFKSELRDETDPADTPDV